MLKPGFRVISDLHLWGREDPLYSVFVRWIEETSNENLILLGDVFDVLVGSHAYYRKAYSEFFQALEKVTERGVQVHFVEGNHDFLLKDLFQYIPRLQYHDRDFTLAVNGKRFYFAHGDLANPSDRSYRVLRSVLRSLPFQAVVSVAPAELILWVGSKWSRYSRDQKPVLIQSLPPEQQKKFRTPYRNFSVDQGNNGFDYIILGHCHDADEMGFKIGTRECFYMNIGFPRVHHQFIEWQSGFLQPKRVSLF